MMTEAVFPEELQDGLWHTTSLSRYEGIKAVGSILPNPDIPDTQRWGTNLGPEYYPYARFLGGVSLFDFRGFDPDAYSERCPMSSWWEFVPYLRSWGSAIWIEIDRTKICDHYIDGVQLLARWHRENAERHKLMPFIEAVHIGPIPLQAVSRVLRVGEDDPRFVEVSISQNRVTRP